MALAHGYIGYGGTKKLSVMTTYIQLIYVELLVHP